MNGIENQTILLLSKQLLIPIFNSSIKFRKYGIRLDYIDGDTIIPPASQLVVGGLAHGFQFVDEKLSTLQNQRFIRKNQTKDSQAEIFPMQNALKNYNELEKGDYVVHQVHGIGQYLGIETIEISVSIVIMFQFNIKMEIASRFLSIRFRCCPNTLQSDGKRQN